MQLTDEQKDILAESFNQGIGKAANSFAILLGNKYEVHLDVPDVLILSINEMFKIIEQKAKKVTTVELDYTGPFEGHSLMVYSFEDSQKLAQLLTGEEIVPDTLSEDDIDALKEVANIVLNAGIGTIGNIFSAQVETGLPNLKYGKIEDCLSEYLDKEETNILYIKSKFNIGDNPLDIVISLLLESSRIEELLSFVNEYHKKLFGEK
ncbi:MAG: hypothetical protein H6622_12165 [Halobacteriovoraceae bacterium]|nr:hypothetical protein [Halobacteriovoraceae bacterium]